jgi:phage-related protein
MIFKNKRQSIKEKMIVLHIFKIKTSDLPKHCQEH